MRRGNVCLRETYVVFSSSRVVVVVVIIAGQAVLVSMPREVVATVASSHPSRHLGHGGGQGVKGGGEGVPDEVQG